MTHIHRRPNSSSAEKNRSDTMAKSPSHDCERVVLYLIFRLRNYPQAGGTRPGVELMHMLRKGQLEDGVEQGLTTAEQFYALAA